MKDPRPNRAFAASACALFLLLLPPPAPSQTPSPTSEIARPETRTFASQILGRDVSFDVLAPPGFETGSPSNAPARLPVLYWLPDIGTPSDRFALPPNAVHDAIRRRIIPPLWVVYVRDGAASFHTDAASGRLPASTLLVHELIPAVDRAFPTVPDRAHRAIQGVGRGGFGAFFHAFAHPEAFGSAAAFAGSFPPTNAWANDPALRPLYAEVFGADPARLATNHPALLARTHADRVRGRTGFRLAVAKSDPRSEESRTMRTALRDARIDAEWSESIESLPSPGTGLLSDATALAGLEFASAWFGPARAADRDGPWVNRPPRLPPRLRHHLVFSDILDRPVGYSLYLPPDVSPSPTNPLPVVYHLPGRNEDEGSHLETTGYLDVALRLGDVPPWAWVWLYGGRSSWFMDSADGRIPSQSVLLDEVIPHIESRWSLGGSPHRRAVDGWGMGAYGAIRYAALAPPVFGAALIHNPFLPDLATLPGRFPDAWSGVFNTNPKYFSETEPLRLLTRNADALRDVVRFRIVTGELAPVLPDARRLRDHLGGLQYSAEFEAVPKTAGSGPELLRQTALRDLRFLGKAVTRPEP